MRNGKPQPRKRTSRDDAAIYVVVGIDAPMHQCTDVPMYQCTDVPMYQCTHVPMYQCTDVPM